MKFKALLLILFCFYSCQNKLKDSVNLTSEESNRSEKILVDKTDSKDNLLIDFEKMTNQYGYPAYSLKFYSNGMVIFNRHQNPDVFNRNQNSDSTNTYLKTINSSIEKSELDDLMSAFSNSNFLNLSASYVEGDNCKTIITHEQSVSISYYDNGIAKTVVHYQGCRGNDDTNTLMSLEKKLDELVENKKWMD